MVVKHRKRSIEDRIAPISEAEQFITMLVYGQANRGKTVFSCTFPKPLLLLDIKEEGQDSVTDVEEVDILHVESWEDIEEIYWDVLEPGKSKYASVVIDQLTAMQALGMDKLRKEKGQKPSEVFSERSWGQLGGLMTQWVYNYRELKKKGLHVCFNAHERTREAQETEDERIAPQVGPNVTPSIASFVNGAVSVIGNAFVREKYDKKTKEHTVQFCMRVGPHAYYAAKIRRPMSAGPPPDVIVNPTFDKVLRVVKGQDLTRKKAKRVE